MATIEIVSQENKKVGTMELADGVFGVPVNVALVHQVIKAQLAGRRQGTHKVKTKAEVRGGGKKPYKQKGTGNARRGSTRSPICVGGGQAHGPTPRDYSQKTPKKMMQGALRSALSDRFKANRIVVIDQFKLVDIKTKSFSEVLAKKFKVKNVLIVDEANENLMLSARNIGNTKVLRTEGLNVYDIVDHEWLFLTKNSVETLQARLQESAKG
jgi:large subunit ribosomal protein L4